MASAGFKMLTGFKKISPLMTAVFSKNKLYLSVYTPEVLHTKSFRPAYSALLKVMKARRKMVGPDRIRKRNEWNDWDYKSELYAFDKRLHENVTEETLRSVFIHQSYIDTEEKKRQEYDMPVLETDQGLKCNINLITLGEETMSNYIKRYLRHCFKALPEEGICAVHDHLMSDDVLSHVSFNIGTSDLILCSEYPPSKCTLAKTLKAFIGAIVTDQTKHKAEIFVLDFVCTQMIGKDVFDIWDLNNPVQVLNFLLEKHGLPLGEPRLIFESGRNTIESIYHIGIYSNRIFLGRGAGETLAIAEDMAAYDVLRKVFHITHHEPPLPFGTKGHELQLSSEKENKFIMEWFCDDFKVKAQIEL